MEKYAKYLAILLAAAMLLGLAACGANETATETTDTAAQAATTTEAPATQAPQDSYTYEGLALTCETSNQTVHLGIGEYLWVNHGDRRILAFIDEEYRISAAGVSDLRAEEVESVDIPAGVKFQMGMNSAGQITLTGLEGSVQLSNGKNLPIAAPESPDSSSSLGFQFVLAQYGAMAETITVTMTGDSSFSRTIAAGDEIVIAGNETDGYSVIF